MDKTQQERMEKAPNIRQFDRDIYGIINQERTYLRDTPPSLALRLPAQQVIYMLERRLGHAWYQALNPDYDFPSPLVGTADSQWIKKVNMVGVNVRTVGSFWQVVKYALTLSPAQNALHLLPMWEPGVVASLYGMCSWQINPEFFSHEWHQIFPHLDTVEKQLKVTVNILHALGKTVGMDVIPHTDRYAEQALANPSCFEWLQRIDTDIVRHDNNLHEVVQDLIFDHLKTHYTGDLPPSSAAFFGPETPEAMRLHLLFGAPHDYQGRLAKREKLIQYLYDHHFETVPATMGPPYRGLAVDTTTAPIEDEAGRLWRDYTITQPTTFSRVFGPLTRYKLYENKDNNAAWAIDFDRPIAANWVYVAQHYANIQAQYNLDFMRGDMAHVQMRPEGVPAQKPDYYDIMGYIKDYIARQVPYFASFAETFLAPPDEMAYGDEVAHLEMAAADSTLGDLQSMVVGSPVFMQSLKTYLDILYSRTVAPNFTLMTGDKDDPRFDAFYLKGNEARFFIGLFLTDMPSYMGLGFEQRDPHPAPVANEYYTKLYVFHLETGDKATKGPYRWGQNWALCRRLNQIKQLADVILPKLSPQPCTWLAYPDPTAATKVIAWQCRAIDGHYLFTVNLDIDRPSAPLVLSLNGLGMAKILYTSTDHTFPDTAITQGQLPIAALQAGECRVYKY